MLEEPEKEEVKVAGDQETVWKAMKGLGASGKYRCHFDIMDVK
jgi:nitrate/TMAO reductase-like tetraheme cytochrome c subunit